MFCIIVDKCLFFDFKGIRKKAQEIQKYNDSPHLLSRGGYELLEKKLMAEKRKIREEQAAFTEDPSLYLPPSPISRHEKWKSARTKQYGQMMQNMYSKEKHEQFVR